MNPNCQISKLRFKVIVSLLAILAAGSIYGQRDLYKWQINGQAGVLSRSSGISVPNDFSSYSTGIRMERRIWSAWTLGVNLLQAHNNSNIPSFSYSAVGLGFHWDNGFLLNERAFIAPFHRIFAGFGYNFRDDTFAKGNAWGFENGLKFRLGYKWSMDTAMEIIAPQKEFNASSPGSNTYYSIYKIGIAYYFGRRESNYTGPVFRAVKSKNVQPFAWEKVREIQDSVVVNEVSVHEKFSEEKQENDTIQPVLKPIYHHAEADSVAAKTEETDGIAFDENHEETRHNANREISKFSQDTPTETEGKEALTAKPTEARTFQGEQISQKSVNQATMAPQESFAAPTQNTVRTTQNTTILPPAVITSTHETTSMELVEQNRILAEQNTVLRALVNDSEILYVANTEREDSLENELEMLKQKYESLLNRLAYDKLDSLFSRAGEAPQAVNPEPSDSVLYNGITAIADTLPFNALDTTYRAAETKFRANGIPESDTRDNQGITTPVPSEYSAKGMYPVIIYFDLNMDRPSEDDLNRLDVVVGDLNQIESKKVRLTGYTDKSGTPAYNLEISRRRTNHIFNHLIRQGIGPERIEIDLQGSQNATEKFNPNLRRVEVELISKE